MKKRWARHHVPDAWDHETEVLVIGYGASGAVSAIVARENGARVTIIEKADRPGGSSVLAGGAVKMAVDFQGAFEYLSATQGGRCEPELIKAMATGMCENLEFIKELAQANGAKVSSHLDKNRAGPESYPLPGWRSLGSVIISEIPGFKGFPWIRGAAGAGQRLMKLLMDNVQARRIEAIFSCAAEELIQDCQGAVLGVRAKRQGKDLCLKAGRGVILACGGFEFNEKLKAESFEAYPVHSMGHLANTGDGILMVQKAGAALWHMWHFHGSYGFKFPEYPMGFRLILAGPRNPSRKVAWINVDKSGRRFMNEYHHAPQDTMHRPFQHFDSDLPGFSRIPCYLIFDELGRLMGPIAKPMSTEDEYIYEWSKDNSQEVEKGWIVSSKTLAGLAAKIGVDARGLKETVARWNQLCRQGKELDFNRPPSSMTPIEKPPFYAIEAWPICTNTQGGPVHNAQQQVLDPYGNPIPRLYAVGELGSFYGHIYLLGGNLAECFVGGRIAGKAAARETAW